MLFVLFFFPDQRNFYFSCHLWNIHVLVSKQNVGAGKNTLMSSSDGLRPSIFCRRMEKMRPMSEKMDGKVVYFLPKSALPLWCCHFKSTFPSLYLNLARKQLFFPSGKGINRRNESTRLTIVISEEPLILTWVLTIIPSIVDFLLFQFKTVKPKLIFP